MSGGRLARGRLVMRRMHMATGIVALLLLAACVLLVQFLPPAYPTKEKADRIKPGMTMTEAREILDPDPTYCLTRVIAGIWMPEAIEQTVMFRFTDGTVFIKTTDDRVIYDDRVTDCEFEPRKPLTLSQRFCRLLPW
jgi:hypothetical protein